MEEKDLKTEESKELNIGCIIDSMLINQHVQYQGKDYKIYNVMLLLEPEDDGAFEQYIIGS